ncbi:MAG TPA: ABC transporter permease [Planctomycetota bacterium]|nr:ABC transporter permease [Planctomycetota bacterium]
MARAEVFDHERGPWSRFAGAFQSRKTSRLAWRALLLCIGLTVFAPLLANDRPYFAKLRDTAGVRQALSLLSPIASSFVDSAKAAAASQPGSQATFEAEERALASRIDLLQGALDGKRSPAAIEALAALERSAKALGEASRAHDAARCETLGLELSKLASDARPTWESSSTSADGIVVRRSWPLFAALTSTDVTLIFLWLGLAGFPWWTRLVPARSIRSRLALLLVFALLAGLLSTLFPRGSTELDTSLWKARIAADAQSASVFPPIAFGPSETHLEDSMQAPRVASRHWCGTDALGRDLLARLLYAGRTSFAVAGLAAVLMVGIGSLLGLAAGALRGLTDTLVSRAIELLQSFPTLVLLLGLISLLPARAANSRWTIPLVIAAIGWTHIARLARAEAMRVHEMAFVRAATAAGFSRARVLRQHVLPNSMGPVWVAASFVLSGGLVLESSAAFLGFGIQHPAPSWGGLLADARGGDAWWLAVFPGLWLFAAILSIHLVGEGVRDALDPRTEAGLP